MRAKPSRTPRGTLALAITALLLLTLTGCAAMRGGPQSFLEVAEKPVENRAMTELRSATDETDRNSQINKAMADVDAFYVAYRDALLRSDNRFNASVDLLSLLTDVAGRAADATAAKDNYLSLGALLTGSRSAINNRFYYAQTGIALVKGMDAARAERALAIKGRQRQRIDEYTGRDAFGDVLQYYFDGTLAGGLLWLQANASKNEADNKAKTAQLRVPTQQQFDDAKQLQKDVEQRLGDEAALRRALKHWKVADPEPGLESARSAFLRHYRQLRDAGVSADLIRAQLSAANFFKDPS